MMKVKNRLLNFGDNIIYQDDDCFLFSLDSMLLANFVTIRLSDKKIIDFCSGNAPVPMLLSFRTKARLFGVELQEYIYEMGLDSIVQNGMDKQITFINDDINNINHHFDADTFDVVTCNPPYFKYKSDSLVNINDKKTIARHEVTLKLNDVIVNAKYLLRTGGIFAMIHRPERLIEIINIMQQNNIEPKRLRMVYPKIGKEANMILIEGIKNGKSGLKIEKPLIVYDNNNKYVEEVRKMFGGNENVAEKL